MESLSNILPVASDLARLVGARIAEELKRDEHAVFERKGPTDLVTEIDTWSEAEIVRVVADKFPAHRVVGEEGWSSRFAGERDVLEREIAQGIVWVVDPLDGTTNFANRIPIVSVSIGVLVNGRREIGVIFDPAHDELFTAVRGKGAFLNGKPIRVSQKSELLDSVISVGFSQSSISRWPEFEPTFRVLQQQSRAIRRLGSACLDQCWVACGRLDGYWECYLKPWDVAAGSLIVEEAGGVVLDPLQPTAPFSLFSAMYVASNPKLLQKIRAIQI